MAIDKSSEAGMKRPDSLMRAMRSIAAAEQTAAHRPPSAAKHFCGAKY
jgi:hypothetical protein